MSVSSEHREEGVRQGPALPVEGIPVPVLALLEPDVNVDAAGVLPGEGEVSVLTPDVERLLDLGVHVSLGEPPGGRVAADLVGQVLHAPTAACI